MSSIPSLLVRVHTMASLASAAYTSSIRSRKVLQSEEKTFIFSCSELCFVCHIAYSPIAARSAVRSCRKVQGHSATFWWFDFPFFSCCSLPLLDVLDLPSRALIYMGNCVIFSTIFFCTPPPLVKFLCCPLWIQFFSSICLLDSTLRFACAFSPWDGEFLERW